MATTTRARNMLTAWPVGKLASLAMGGAAYFALMVLALHFLRPDLNPIALPASAYAVGPFGFLMTTAFFGLTLGAWALVLAIARGVPSAARSRAGLILLGVWAAGILLAMVFPMDVDRAAPTLSGTIHDLGGVIGFFCLSVGGILMTRRLTAVGGWGLARRAMLTLSVLMLAQYVAVSLAFATGSQFLGLVQRLYLGTMITWIVMTASRLRASAGDAH